MFRLSVTSIPFIHPMTCLITLDKPVMSIKDPNKTLFTVVYNKSVVLWSNKDLVCIVSDLCRKIKIKFYSFFSIK